MTDEQLNERLHEIMGLKCCYWWLRGNEHNFSNNKDWRAFGVMWEWLQTRHGYEEFMHKYGYGSNKIGWYLKECYISPRALAEAVVEFFKEVSHD